MTIGLKRQQVRRATGLWLAATAGMAMAQTAPDQTTVPDQTTPQTSLDIPSNLQIFGKVDPNVRKPTAIVNDSVITGTDVDQRVGLLVAANGGQISPEDRDKLKLQTLRQLIDETLEIQEANTQKITITNPEIDQSFDRVASNFKMSPADFRAFLRKQGSSEKSLKRQIEGEIAWQRYLRKEVEPTINVGDEEVKGILDRLQRDRGTVEYQLREIFLRDTPSTAQQVFTNARQLIQSLAQGGPQAFDAAARQYSEASTKGVGGDLGWIRANTLPDALAGAVEQMQVGQVAGPIEVPGGYSILYLSDKRQVLTADARDARLSLKQLTIPFPPNTSAADASARAAAFGKAIQTIQGCGAVEKVAQELKADVVSSDSVRVRDLPPQLQQIVLNLQVGQATPPFGSADQGVRALVLCGRDEVKNGELPRADQVQDQLEQQRVNLRAQQKLRDLRRDAIIEYR